MDTISRENNSMLPVAGAIMGGLALLIGGFAAIKVSTLQKAVAAQQEKVDKIDGLESQLGSVSAATDKAGKDIISLTHSSQDAFNTISTEFGNIHASITKLEESAKKPVAAAGKGGHNAGPVVAGPGEYVIKAGDTFAKIGRANGGFSGKQVAEVNPGVDAAHLHVGQKIKLPVKQ